MLLKKFSLDRELAAEQNREMSRLMREVERLIENEKQEDERINNYFPAAHLVENSEVNDGINFTPGIYTLESIKNICIKFRLRFLPSSYYKGKLPYDAILKIKNFEKTESQSEIKGYHIMAPQAFFALKDRYADPLLFAEMKNGQYILLHKWGSDFNWYTKIINYPFRDFRSVAITACFFGILSCMLASFLGIGNDANLFKAFLLKVPIFVLTSGFLITMAVIYGLVTYKDFSDENWNSRYFN